jgi:outer membrane biosynthesis protein TonB
MPRIVPACRENLARRGLSRLGFMPRLPAFPLVLLLSAAAALGLAACGSGDEADLLPGGTANEINANLDRVEQLADEGDCAGASEAAEAVSVQVEELGGVDAKLKQALREGAARLNEVVTGCEEVTTEEETLPAIEPAEEPEEEEKEPEKEKSEKPDESEAEKEADEAEEEASSTLPPQSEGEAKGHEKQEEAPPAETGGGSSSGGLGPGTPAEGE